MKIWVVLHTVSDPPYLVIDVDDCIVDGNIQNKELEDDIRRLNTFTEISQSTTGIHIVGIGDGNPVPYFGYDEVYSEGHWIYLTGNVYKNFGTINNIEKPLLELIEERKSRETPRSKKAKPLEIKINGNARNFNQYITEEYGLDVSVLGMPLNPINRGNGIIQGENPFHGSSTGFNYIIDTVNNRFKCFRNHKSCGVSHGGGSGLELFAISHGIIDCEDAKSGWFDDKEIQVKVFDALKQAGYYSKKDAWMKKFNMKVR